MKEDVAKYIRGCKLCHIVKPNYRNKCLYHPLPIPTCPLEIIFMDFVGGLLATRKGHDYLLMVGDRSSSMCTLIPC